MLKKFYLIKLKKKIFFTFYPVGTEQDWVTAIKDAVQPTHHNCNSAANPLHATSTTRREAMINLLRSSC